MAKIEEREKAIKLRKAGESIRNITKQLGVSKSSVSYWCRDISLTESQIKKLSKQQRLGALKAAENKRKKRKKRVKEMKKLGAREVGAINKRDLFMLGLALYWGEGYKRGSQETALTNSDPSIIKLFIRWLEEIYSISRNDLILRVSINEIHKNRESKVIRYWSQITQIPQEQFTKTSYIKTKTKKKYKNKEKHFGTLRVKVRRGTDLRRRILGSIEALK